MAVDQFWASRPQPLAAHEPTTQKLLLPNHLNSPQLPNNDAQQKNCCKLKQKHNLFCHYIEESSENLAAEMIFHFNAKKLWNLSFQALQVKSSHFLTKIGQLAQSAN